ncbi:MAG: DUF1653 domain-containing protein [Clostridia bacterium]|nr:DUF1653 domain-containing protein [Clostridia bacterium]
MEEIKEGIYKHFKGKFVYVHFVAKHSDREESLVIYKGLNDGGYFARPVESFLEMVENKEGVVVPRFSKATEEDIENLKNQGLI